VKGKKYILVKDLRMVLTTIGDKLSDEEADELIRECNPLPGDDGTKDEGKVFFEQYRCAGAIGFILGSFFRILI